MSIIYDLSKVKVDTHEKNKTVTITAIPDPEIKIVPDLKYYDISGDFINPFNATDINKIKHQVNNTIHQRVMQSDLSKNAKNRLITELSQLYMLTNSMGWQLIYNEALISDIQQLETLQFKD